MSVTIILYATIALIAGLCLVGACVHFSSRSDPEPDPGQARRWFALAGIVAILVLLPLGVGRLVFSGRPEAAVLAPEPEEHAAGERTARLPLPVSDGPVGAPRVERPVPTRPVPSASDAVPERAADPLDVAHFTTRPTQAEMESSDEPVLSIYYENGQLAYEAERVRDERGGWILEGSWKAWHANGAALELGAFKRDEPDGEWQWWYENGSRMSRGHYHTGKRAGAWTFWHENDRLLAEGWYVEDVGAGHWVLYDAGGLKVAEGDFVDGEPEGAWTVWNPEDGSINEERTGIYRAGELVGDD